jgi:hypothetical protein
MMDGKVKLVALQVYQLLGCVKNIGLSSLKMIRGLAVGMTKK